MDIDASVENISKDTAEIIEVEELKELLKKYIFLNFFIKFL